MIYKDIKVTSNLGYAENSTVTMELIHTEEKNIARLKFSTGFETECKYLGIHRDHTNAQITTYSYKGYGDETHHLHVRITDDKLYCQTLQTVKSAGGSSWIINKN